MHFKRSQSRMDVVPPGRSLENSSREIEVNNFQPHIRNQRIQNAALRNAIRVADQTSAQLRGLDVKARQQQQAMLPVLRSDATEFAA